MRRLEPGEAADYTKDWQWPLEDMEDAGKEKGKGIEETVEVETTKKRFTQPARLNRVTISGNVEDLLELIPRKKLLPPPLRPK